jgi:hypothetical protein
MEYINKNLTCTSCGKLFLFTAGEQQFYAASGRPTPTMCGSCRAAANKAKTGKKDEEYDHEQHH